MASRNLVRSCAAILGASLTMIATALPASAEATGHVNGQDRDGYSINFTGNGRDGLMTKLMGFELDGSKTKLEVYCVQINVNIDRQHPGMVEVPWNKYPDANSPFHANREHINWVLQNGFPVKDVSALKTAIGRDTLEEREAITATQAAAWHYSDNQNLDLADPINNGGDAEDEADVVALYKYLTGDKNVGIADEPEAASLELTPGSATGKAGDKVGPFEVKTTGDITELTSELPEGVKVTDADGKELKAEDIKNGSKIFFTVPADAKDGEGTFTLNATGHVEAGRLFIGNEKDGDKTRPTQSLIVATAKDTKLSAKAKADWKATPVTTPETTTPPVETTVPTTPAPQPDTGGLAYTGASIFVPILIGVLLVGGGVAALLFQRRRKGA